MDTPQSAPPVLFESTLSASRLQRASRIGPADFLLVRAAEDLTDRLAGIMRTFPEAIDFGTPGAQFCASLRHTNNERSITRIAPAGSVTESISQTLVSDLVSETGVLPLSQHSADLIVSGYALHSVNDLPGALIQIRRALRADGLFLACLAGGKTLHELREVLAQAEADVLGGVSPRVFPFAEIRDMGGLLQRAGFTLPVADTDTVTVRYASMINLMHDLRAMAQTNILTERLKRPTPRSVFIRAAELYAERHADPDGRIRATFETIWISGWAPHESQQKPLKPGSAKARLADALKTIEIGVKP